MTRIHFKSDFALVISQPLEGSPARFALYDFDLTVRVGRTRYTAWHHGDEWHNCRPLDDASRLYISVDNHGLDVGPVTVETVYHIPDPGFADGSRDVAVKTVTDVTLTLGPSDTTEAPVEIIPPFVREPAAVALELVTDGATYIVKAAAAEITQPDDTTD